MPISVEYNLGEITAKSISSQQLGHIDFALSVFASVSMRSCQALDIVSTPYSSHTFPLVSYDFRSILRWRVAIVTKGRGELVGENVD